MPLYPNANVSTPKEEAIEFNPKKGENRVASEDPVKFQKHNSNDIIPGETFKPSKYYSDLYTFDRTYLLPISGYDSYKENPKYFPGLSPDENIRRYAMEQSRGEWWSNVGNKFLNTTLNSFLEGWKQDYRNFDALKNWDSSKLFSQEDKSFEEDMNRWKYPTYGTGEMDDLSFWRDINPFTSKFSPWNWGKSDFGGEFIPQLGFTIGTMGQAILQNTAIEFLTEGTGTGLAAAKTAFAAGKVGKGFWKLFEVANGVSNFRKGVQVANAIRNESSFALKSKAFVQQFPKLFAQGYAIYNSAASEAAFQANSGYTQQFNELRQSFIDAKGYEPFGKDLDDIKENAIRKGVAEFGWNLPVLMASNLVQFKNIILPFKAAKDEANLIMEGIEIVGKGTASKFARKAAAPAVTGTLNKVFNVSKRVGKSLADPISEMADEFSQGGVTAGTSGYYKSLYEAAHPDINGKNSMLNSIFDYVGSQASIEESVGGFMGGAMFKGVGKLADISGIRDSKVGSQLFGHSEKFKEKSLNKKRDEVIDVLNNVSSEEISKYLFSPDVSNFVIQTDLREKMSKSLQENDIKTYNDLKAQSVRNFLYTAIQNDMLDLAISKLDTYKELDDADIAQQQNLKDPSDILTAKSKMLSKIENIKEQAVKMQEDYNTLRRKYGQNPYSKTEKIGSHIAWENAFRERVFMKDAIEQDKRFSNDLRKDISTFSNGVITSNIIDHAVDNNLLSQQIGFLKNIQNNVIDQSDHVYKIQMQQLSLLEDIQKEKGKKDKKDNNKIATLLEKISDLNRDSNTSAYMLNLHKEENHKRLKDVLDIEDRHIDSVQHYNLLNNKPLDKSIQEHMDAMNDVAQNLKKEADTLSKKKRIEDALSKYNDIPPLVEAFNKMSPDDQNIYREFFTQRKNELKSKHVVSENQETKKFEVKDGEGNVISTHDSKEVAETSSKELSKPKIGFTGETPDDYISEAIDDTFSNKRKLLNVRYLTDTSTKAEELSTVNTQDPEFHRRKDVLLEKLQNNSLLDEKGVPYKETDVKVLLITPDNVNQFGKNIDSLLTNKDVSSPETASILLFFVIEKNGELFPVFTEGASSIPLSPSFEIDFQNPQVVYSFLDSVTEDNYSIKNSRNSKGTALSDVEIVSAKKQAIEFRKEILSSKEKQLFHFNISNGLPNKSEAQNSVTHIIPSIQYNSVFVPTTGTEGVHTVKLKNGEERKLIVGRPYLIIKDGKGNIVNYLYLNNHKLTQNQKDVFYAILESIQKEYISTKKPLNVTNYPQLNFLSHFLFYQDNLSSSAASFSLKVDEQENVNIVFNNGGSILYINVLAAKSTPSLQEWLDSRYTNISKPDNKSFLEYYLKKGKLSVREWKSYSEYLLSDKNRDISEIPLTTSLSTPQQVVENYEKLNDTPTKFIVLNKQRYVTLIIGKKVDDKGVPITTETTITTVKESSFYEDQVKPALLHNKEFQQFAEDNVDGEDVDVMLSELETSDSDEITKEDVTKEIQIFLFKKWLNSSTPVNPTIEEDIQSVITNSPENVSSGEKDTEKKSNTPTRQRVKRGDKNEKRATKLFEKDKTPKGYTRENIETIKEFFKKNLPQVSLEWVDSLIAISDGTLAWGTFHGSIVTLFKDSIVGTGYHEAFEVVFNGLLTAFERNNLLSEFKSRKGKFSNFSTNGEISYKDATDHQAKEELAEEFMRYKLTGVLPKYEHSKNIFQKLLYFIRKYILKLDDIETVFSKIETGRYAKRELKPSKTVQTKLTGLGIIETQQYLEGFTQEFLNILYRKTGAFTALDRSFIGKEIYEELFQNIDDYYNSTELNGNTHNNALLLKYRDALLGIETKNISDIQKDALVDGVNDKMDEEWLEKKNKWNDLLKPQWDDILKELKSFFEQTGVLIKEEDVNENANYNDYTKDSFKIDSKSTAPTSIKFLVSSIVDSVLDFDVMVDYQNGKFTLPNIVPKYVEATGMGSFIKDSNALYNVLLSQLTELNNLSLIKEKFEQWLGLNEIQGKSKEETEKFFRNKQQSDSLYVSLLKVYTRIFNKSETDLSLDEVNQRLKLLSFLSKRTPMFKKQLIGWDGRSFFIDSVTDAGRKKVISNWMKALRADVFTKDKMGFISKKNKNSPFVVNIPQIDFILDIKDKDLDKFILFSAKRLMLGKFINKGFINSISISEKNEIATHLENVLKLGFKKLWDGTKGNKIRKLNANKIGASVSMNGIANIINKYYGDDVDSIHSNIDGEQQQNVVLHNTASILLSEMKSATSMEDFISNNPEYKGIYAQGSEVLKRIIEEKEDIRISVIEGTQDVMKDTGKSSQDQTLSERLFQEFNANLDNEFYMLVPGDSNTESAISYKKPFINFTNSSDLQMELFVTKMIEHLRTEIEVAKNFDSSILSKNEQLLKIEAPKEGMAKRPIGKSLTFFKGILSSDILEGIYEFIDANVDTQEIIDAYQEDIFEQLSGFIQQKVHSTFRDLNNNFFVSVLKDFRNFSDLDRQKTYLFYGLNSSFSQVNNIDTFLEENDNAEVSEQAGVSIMNGEMLHNIILNREINYILSNIEVTKLFFGNPIFYKNIMKRIKSLLSPKEVSYHQNKGSHRFNELFTHNLNNVPENHPHYHVFKNHMNAWVFKDNYTFNSLLGYNNNNSSDAQSFFMLNTYREFLWKNAGRFDEGMEKEFQLQQAFDRFLLDMDGIVPYKDATLKKADSVLLDSKIKQTENGFTLIENYAVFHILKPLGSGFLAEDEQIPFIWKTSVAPITYSSVRGTAMQNVYVEMLKNKIDILTFESAVKVGLMEGENGVENVLDITTFENLGNSKNEYNSFVHKIPFKTTGIQQETESQKDESSQGSQATKLITTDLFNYGIPVDFMKESSNFEEVFNEWNSLSEKEKEDSSYYYRLSKKHTKAIKDLETIGYINLIKRLGIKEVKDDDGKVVDFEYKDLNKTYSLLKKEMIKRGLSPNSYGLLEDDSIEVKPLEALSNYEQTSFIIMSLIKKQIVQPKLNGGQKIQMSSAFLNSLKKEKLKAFYKKGDSFEEILTEEQFYQLSDEEKSSIRFSSEQLKFYSKNADGTTSPMEIYISSSILDKVNKHREKKGMEKLSGEELIEYLNKKQFEILEGIGFRIPTQALFSMDAFVIKGFLPSFMGDAVAVPSELTTKTGSDFDVDKLNTYLNNFRMKEGYPEYIPAMELDEAINYFSVEFSSKKQAAINYKSNLLVAVEKFTGLNKTEKANIIRFIRISKDEIIDYLEYFDTDEEAIEALRDSINDINGSLSDEELKESFVNRYTKKSLENRYFSIMREILLLPQNYDNLLSINHSDEFSGENGIRDTINAILGNSSNDNDMSVLLDSKKMRYVRWAFVNGQKGVGASANNTTNNAVSQMIGFKVNAHLTSEFKKYIEIYNTPINFNHNTTILQDRVVSLLSGIEKYNGENIAKFISKYVNGYVDISNDRWVLEIGATLDIAGIYMIMERLGIDSEEISYFMNQPVIRFYLEMQNLRNSPIRRINRDLSKLLSDFSDEGLYNYIKNSTIGRDQSPTEISKFTSEKLKNNLISSKGMNFTDWVNSLSVADKNYQFRVFSQFLTLQEVAKYVQSSQSATNFDTSNINSLYLIDDKVKQLNTLSESSSLVSTLKDDRMMADALLEDTFNSNIFNIYNILDDNFLSRYLFRIQSKEIRMLFRDLMEDIADISTEHDRRKFLSKITRVAINILLQNSKNIKTTSYISDIEAFMKYENLKNHIESYKVVSSNTKDLLDISGNQWIKNIQVTPVDDETGYGYISFGNKPTAGSFEEKQWIEDFRNLYNNASTKKLATFIINASMIQSGVEFNRQSYSQLIPYEYFYKIVNIALGEINSLKDFNLKRLVAQMKSYDTSFVKELSYLPFAKTPKGKSVNTMLGVFSNNVLTGFIQSGRGDTKISVTNNQVNRILLVPEKAYNSELPYFTIRQPHSSYSLEEIKEMKKEQNFDYQAKILFEKTPFKANILNTTYNIFVPINSKGDRYLQVASDDNAPSILSIHEKVNPMFGNYKQLKNAIINSPFNKDGKIMVLTGGEEIGFELPITEQPTPSPRKFIIDGADIYLYPDGAIKDADKNEVKNEKIKKRIISSATLKTSSQDSLKPVSSSKEILSIKELQSATGFHPLNIKGLAAGAVKDTLKMQQGNKLIAFGEEGSSTAAYRKEADEKNGIQEVKGENITSKGSSFAKLLTNVGNTVGLTYKGKPYINSEHAYQTWKSGEFNQQGYDLKGGKVRGGKIGDTFSIMVDILTEKLKQHPELVQGINERGGLEYIKNSTHNVIGDKFWETNGGQNKFIEALLQAAKNVGIENKNTKPVTSISVRKDNKKVLYTLYNFFAKKNQTKSGYKLTIPEFTDVEMYLTNETSTQDSVEGSNEFNIKGKNWSVEIKHPTKGVLTIPTPYDSTIKDVLEALVNDINNKHSKTENGIKKLKEVGIDFTNTSFSKSISNVSVENNQPQTYSSKDIVNISVNGNNPKYDANRTENIEKTKTEILKAIESGVNYFVADQINTAHNSYNNVGEGVISDWFMKEVSKTYNVKYEDILNGQGGLYTVTKKENNISEKSDIEVYFTKEFNNFTEDQKTKVGSVEKMIEEYENIPFEISKEQFIEQIKCNS